MRLYSVADHSRFPERRSTLSIALASSSDLFGFVSGAVGNLLLGEHRSRSDCVGIVRADAARRGTHLADDLVHESGFLALLGRDGRARVLVLRALMVAAAPGRG